MGAKGLKYVAVDNEKKPVRRAAEMKEFAALCKTYTKEYRDGPQMFKTGTSSVVPVATSRNTEFAPLSGSGITSLCRWLPMIRQSAVPLMKSPLEMTVVPSL